MIVGDPDRFAVEFELDSNRMSEPDFFRWLWGRIRWWCGGQSVGIFEAQAQLIDEPTEVAFRTVMAALYEDRGQTFERMREEGAPVGSVPVGPQVYEFDVLVPGVHLRQVWLRAGEFDEVQKMFLDEIAAAEREFSARDGR
ncbi:hypothetical protein NS506_05523 [Nocardia seriolae]|uniref:Uncharacterized protein n=1 Tax=Nocardia seriolae TaxID=37332 RepID=A0ABC8AZ58_9NOCA|nr:hypothetical protein [Nocardia seriolae]APA99569.1 hypothetical protein NS506_05523 [Nocardia seriolae]